VRRMLAPGMFTTVQSACEHCGGRGKYIKKPCAVCSGQRVVRKSTKVSVRVARGAPRGMKLVYENEADEHPDQVAGDLHVVLEEKTTGPEADNADHHFDGTFFRRKGHDLYWHEILSVREAWMGDWARNLTHLDGHIVRLGRPAGQVVQPGHVETVAGEGMPIWNGEEEVSSDDDSAEYQFGKLYVQYTVVLPDQMEKAAEHEFRAVFDKWRKRGEGGVADTGHAGKPSQVAGHDEL